ncbi:MAG TPA: T9SS type A sorting domain-containing protein [Candidatus Kapabacteria bacterium]|mgnify:CR=1 FL=1|nr:T9SS type A sorting domain-containing protein [Candidatus Kapabacteria bacterium]
MKKFFLIVILILLNYCFIFSQEATEGREFWFGLPHCMKSSDEPIRWGTYPVQIWLSSKVDTKATIESLNGAVPKQIVTVRKNEFSIVSINDNLENKESEEPHDYGIHIFSKDPISVSVFIAYKWSGEAFRVIPAEWLGKEYFTLNMYQDYVKMHSGEMEYKPGQIVICATEDNTQIKYYPTVETEKGIKPGQYGSIKLQKGQTFAIKNKIIPELNQDWETDLSGTQIISSKPVSVISGHTKGCFPKYAPKMYGIKADFVRNVLVEVMYPIESLGYEYISAPLKYLSRNYSHAIADDAGDIIRFIATEDSTFVYQMRQDGSGLMQVSPMLNKGERYDILNQELAAYYKSNKKVLVGQYGKSWVSSLPPPKEKPDNEPQNPNMTGEGMMITLAPVERWCSSASFRSQPNMDNFIYLTFKTGDDNKILFDNQTINSKFGTVISEIAGTPYSYLVQHVSSGDHYLSVSENGVKFFGYSYGNWDSYKDGFAYGYPFSINYAEFCIDSIYTIENINCGNIDGEFFAENLESDKNCAAISSIIVDESINCTFTKDSEFEQGDPSVKFNFLVNNPQKFARAVVTANTRSGKNLQKLYEYIPEEITAEQSFIDFGAVPLKDTECKKLTLINKSIVPLIIYDLKLKNNASIFSVSLVSFPVLLNSMESIEIDVCATPDFLTTYAFKDSIIVVLSCYEEAIVGLECKTDEPMLWISDANWGQVPVNVEKSRNVEIVNESKVDVELYSIMWKDSTHFTRVHGLDFPVKIPAEESYYFLVYYKPDSPDIRNTDTAFFTSSATKTKLYSVWNGIGTDKPILIKPDNDTTNLPIEVNFIWDYSGGVNHFKLQISTDNNFLSTQIDTILYQYVFNTVLGANTKYYWRVCAVDGTNFGDWTEVWNFTTGDWSVIKNEIILQNDFIIYPNPAADELSIEFLNDYSNYYEIEIIDLKGITIASVKKENIAFGIKNEKISLKNIPNGVYFCVLKYEGQKLFKAFVKM